MFIQYETNHSIVIYIQKSGTLKDPKLSQNISEILIVLIPLIMRGNTSWVWKKWVTHDCYFRLTTSTVGINVTDSWNLIVFHSLFHPRVQHIYANGNMPLKSFAGILAAELLQLAEREDEKSRMAQKRNLRMIESSLNEPTDDSSDVSDVIEEFEDNNNTEKEQEGSSLIYSFETASGATIDGCKPVDVIMDGYGKAHTVTRFPIVQTGLKQKKRARVQACACCKKETRIFCHECGVAYCYSKGNDGHGRKCFQRHIPSRTCRRINM